MMCAIGKGEVVSSILTGSTTKFPRNHRVMKGVDPTDPLRPKQNNARPRTTLRQVSGKVRSPFGFPTTVALTERAAKVNALVSIFGEMVYATDSDAAIDARFNEKTPPDFYVGPVAIERVIVTDEAEATDA